MKSPFSYGFPIFFSHEITISMAFPMAFPHARRHGARHRRCWTTRSRRAWNACSPSCWPQWPEVRGLTLADRGWKTSETIKNLLFSGSMFIYQRVVWRYIYNIDKYNIIYGYRYNIYICVCVCLWTCLNVYMSMCIYACVMCFLCVLDEIHPIEESGGWPGFVAESCGVNNENSRVLTKPWGFD